MLFHQMGQQKGNRIDSNRCNQNSSKYHILLLCFIWNILNIMNIKDNIKFFLKSAKKCL